MKDIAESALPDLAKALMETELATVTKSSVETVPPVRKRLNIDIAEPKRI
jgi:hypothetical protein